MKEWQVFVHKVEENLMDLQKSIVVITLFID